PVPQGRPGRREVVSDGGGRSYTPALAENALAGPRPTSSNLSRNTGSPGPDPDTCQNVQVPHNQQAKELSPRGARPSVIQVGVPSVASSARLRNPTSTTAVVCP